MKMNEEQRNPIALDPSSAGHASGSGMSSQGGMLRELIHDMRSGNEAAFDELMRTCRDYLLLVANDELSDNLRAKLGPSDIVQSVCLLAYRNIDQFRGSTQRELLAWLRAILRNEVFAAHRKFTTGKRDVDREERGNAVATEFRDGLRTPSSEAILQEEAAALRVALGRLSPDYRRIIILRNWERLQFDEIARRMERSTDAAKKLWARGLAQLRKELRNEENETGR